MIDIWYFCLTECLPRNISLKEVRSSFVLSGLDLSSPVVVFGFFCSSSSIFLPFCFFSLAYVCACATAVLLYVLFCDISWTTAPSRPPPPPHNASSWIMVRRCKAAEDVMRTWNVWSSPTKMNLIIKVCPATQQKNKETFKIFVKSVHFNVIFLFLSRTKFVHLRVKIPLYYLTLVRSAALQHALLKADMFPSFWSPTVYSPPSLSPTLSLSSFFFCTVDQSMFENSIAQQQSPQTSRPGPPSTRRSTVTANSNPGSSCVDSPSSGGQHRLKNAINLGKAVGAKVSATQAGTGHRALQVLYSFMLLNTVLQRKWV